MAAPMVKRERPKVGVGVIVTNKDHPGCVLLGIRKGSAPGTGQYALPGGHLEFGESWEECASRETLEETGLELKNVQYCTVLNVIEADKNYHYIEIFMKGEACSEPRNLEPEKCEEWTWCYWDAFPSLEKQFCALRVLRSANSYNPFTMKTEGLGS